MNDEPKIPAFMDIETLAAHLCLDIATARQWVEEDILPKPVTKQGKERWKWRDVERAMRDEPKEYCRVYFIGTDTGLVKIGYSSDLPQRMTAIAKSVPFAVTLLHDIPGSFDLEKDLHRKFAHLRVRGEWFKADPELMELVEQLKNGSLELPSRQALV